MTEQDQGRLGGELARLNREAAEAIEERLEVKLPGLRHHAEGRLSESLEAIHAKYQPNARIWRGG